MTQHKMDDMDFTKGSFATIMANLEERMTKFEAELEKNLKNPSTTNMVSLGSEFASYRLFACKTMKAVGQQMEVLARDVDNIETRSRRKMLLLHGVPEQKNEETAQVIVGIFKETLKLDEFTPDDIRRCHRMGRLSGANKPRPILMKLEQVSVRDKVWFSKTKLKGTGKTLSEFLTRTRHEIFMAARERFGDTRCFSREGRIFVLDPEGAQYRVASFDELSRLQWDQQKTVTSTKPAATKSRRAAVTKK